MLTRSLVFVIIFAKHPIAQLQQRLHRRPLREHVAHLPLNAARPHDSRRKHNCKIERSHQILLLHAHNVAQMLAQELETIAMVLGQVVDRAAESKSLLFQPRGTITGALAFGGANVRQLAGFEERVVDVVGDEWCGQFAEVLLEGAGDGVDVEVWVGDVVAAGFLFEASLDGFYLAAAAGFAVDAFHVHAALFDFFDATGYDGRDEAFLEFAAELEIGAEKNCPMLVCVHHQYSDAVSHQTYLKGRLTAERGSCCCCSSCCRLVRS